MLLADRYLTDLGAIARTDLGYRSRTVSRMIGLGQDVAYRNRGLYDAWRLLRDEWNADPQWEFTRLRDLPADLPFPAEVPKDLQQRLAEALAQAVAETPASFEDLQAQHPDPTDTAAYMDWFYRYVPYLTLGLIPGETGAAAAGERLKWFCDQLPEGEQVLREAVEDYGWRHFLGWYHAPER